MFLLFTLSVAVHTASFGISLSLPVIYFLLKNSELFAFSFCISVFFFFFGLRNGISVRILVKAELDFHHGIEKLTSKLNWVGFSLVGFCFSWVLNLRFKSNEPLLHFIQFCLYCFDFGLGDFVFELEMARLLAHQLGTVQKTCEDR